MAGCLDNSQSFNTNLDKSTRNHFVFFGGEYPALSVD